MRLIDADAFDRMLEGAQAECRRNGGNFRVGVLSTVRANLAKMPTVGGWISVKDRLPECGYDVLVCNDDGIMGTACRLETSIHPQLWQIKYCLYDNDCWDDDENGVITHWMPLPEPPKEDDE